jgi:hypothetical protein
LLKWCFYKKNAPGYYNPEHLIYHPSSKLMVFTKPLVFSMIIRNYGSAIRARNEESQAREMFLLVLMHNIAIIKLVKELFYRVCLPSLILSEKGKNNKGRITQTGLSLSLK